MSEPLARLSIAPLRRIIGVITTAALGAVLLYVAAVNTPQVFVGTLALVLIGFGAFWQAWLLNRSGNHALELTHDALRLDTGEVLTPLSEVERIERGLFAFKPSNGFVLITRDKHPRAGMPGLWWRFGRRIGVGGTVNAREARMMADIIHSLLAERRSE